MFADDTNITISGSSLVNHEQETKKLRTTEPSLLAKSQ